MKEFKVNEFIIVKQEEYSTNIFVEGHTLVYWSYSIPMSERNEDNMAKEFNNRCSSIQKWIESEYEEKDIPYDIAFPSLKRLSESGEPIAKEVFKRDVVKGFLSGDSEMVIHILGSVSMIVKILRILQILKNITRY